jgi:hypothetical protein
MDLRGWVVKFKGDVEYRWKIRLPWGEVLVVVGGGESCKNDCEDKG